MSFINTSISGGGGGGGPCGACKFLRRRCVTGCIFAPYFDSEQGAAHFAAVHKVFGTSNVSKLLHHIPLNKRLDSVVTLCYEAQARLRDPVYGCVAHIFTLQQQVVNMQNELSYLQAHLATQEIRVPPPMSSQGSVMSPPQLKPSYLPSTTVPPTFDLSALYDPIGPPSWDINNQQHQQHLEFDLMDRGPTHGSDFQAIAHELFQRHGSPPLGHMPCDDSPPPSSTSK